MTFKSETIEDELKSIARQLKEISEKIGSIKKEIEQIEGEEEGTNLKMKKSAILQGIKNKSDEWTILMLAKAFIKKAIDKYERERQPNIIKEAQIIFSKLTNGRYNRIYAPLDKQEIFIEDFDHKQKDIQELSRGTAAQLYLSLRIGFIQEFNKRAEKLPIIFDDILVDFDPERFKEACNLINELSQYNQVFYFTCHPEITHVLTNTVPQLKKVKLGV